MREKPPTDIEQRTLLAFQSMSPHEISEDVASAFYDLAYTPEVIIRRVGGCREETAQALVEEVYDAKTTRFKEPYRSFINDAAQNSRMSSDPVLLARFLIRVTSNIIALKTSFRLMNP